MVNSPNRDVGSMVNIADLFELFGEIAGIDVHKAVPSSHILDSAPMLGYLTNPGQPSIRETNFTQTGNNIQVMAPPPCLLVLGVTPTCAQLMTSKALCHDEGGDWYGPDPTNPDATVYPNCCAVQKAITDGTFPDKSVTKMAFLPDYQNAIRNDTYKVVQIKNPDCNQPIKPNGRFPDTTSTAFYRIDETPKTPMLDNKNNALCGDGMPDCPRGLTVEERGIYSSLRHEMEHLLKSEPPCPGDGNEDKLVNGQDIQSWQFFKEFTHGKSSWSDFNLDGFTNRDDLDIIQDNLGKKCPPKK
jgi:hypothetical protein